MFFGLKEKREELKSLIKELEDAKLELKNTKTELYNVNSALDDSRRELERVNNNTSKVASELEVCEEEINLKREELKNLQAKCEEEKDVDYRLEFKKMELEEMENEYTRIEDKIRDAKSQYTAGLKRYKREIEEEKAQIRAKAEEEVGRVQLESQMLINKMSKEIADTRKKLEDVTNSYNAMQEKYRKARKYHMENSRELDELQINLDEARKEMAQVSKTLKEVEILKQEKKELEEVVAKYNAEDTVNISSVAETPRYQFANSSLCKEELEKIRKRQKNMVEDGRAMFCTTNWSVDGSNAKGRKMTNSFIKIGLKSFNDGSNYIIGSLKYATYTSSKNKLDKLFKDINRLNEINAIRISKDYYDLKMEELELAFRYAEMKEEEKEEQRRVKEQMREEAKRQEEIEEMKKKIEKEQRHYKNELERTLEKEKDAELIRKLRERIAELEESKKDVKKLEATVKAGYVYIISNEGSFGEDVYKIGTTRRLNPFDRVDELGNASVPFKFDVHGMIFSEDCFELEAKLHKIFDAKRVNKINKRKEFFNVSLDEIVAVVNDKLGLNVEFTMEAIAKDYREGMMLD